MPIRTVIKRDEREVPFDREKITTAIFKAAQSVGGEDRGLSEELAGVVTLFLEKHFNGKPPTIEEIQDMVEKVLIETGHPTTAKAYILYRERRRRVRESLQVRKPVLKNGSTTDVSLLVDRGTDDELQQWDRQKIAEALEIEADVEPIVAAEIASAVEKRVFQSGISRVSTALIRELVDNELFERGLNAKLRQQATLGMPKFDIEQLIFSKSKENSNITANNPEAINLAIAENVLKQYSLQNVFSPEVSDAHMRGVVHVHDLGYPTRVYCSSHSLEYLKKYGLSLRNLDTSSAPARHARTLTGHLNTFLASMQAYYAGALGVGYVNVLYAPYIEGMTYKEMLQEAQHLIFSGSQSAFSRGGQTLFLDFNVHTGVPEFMRDTPAIGPSGKVMSKTYGEYEKVAQQFGRAMLDVWRAGDQHGHIFAFPKCDFHITQETFSDPDQYEFLKYACQVAAENGSPYFVFDRDSVTLSACCRLRTKIEDDYMLKHVESMRFCGFQNVTINLPQAAYRAGRGNMDGLHKEIEKAFDVAVEAHLEKRQFISRLMASEEMPLWQVGQNAADGRPYIDLNAATYIVGLIGLNECLQYMTGRELHEGDDVIKQGLRIVSFLYMKAKQEGERLGMKISLEESPAESASRRLAKVDLRNFPDARGVVRGSPGNDDCYYTNSIHLRADAPVDLVTRIRLQSKFHSLIESGAILHAFVGEKLPSPDSILSLVQKTFEKTQAAQLTISPEFTVCNDCHRMSVGMKAVCAKCGSPDTYGVSRIVGYFSRVDNWNRSKLGELMDRRRGRYAPPQADPEVAFESNAAG